MSGLAHAEGYDVTPPSLPMRSRWALALALLIVGAIAAAFALAVDGGPASRIASGTLGLIVIFASSASLLARAALSPRERLGWALIGTGVLLWAIGDLLARLVFVDPSMIEIPSLRTIFHLGFYAAAIAGVRALGGRLAGYGVISVGLLVAILGLATLWSWIAFEGVAAGVSAADERVAVTVAYPALDLALITSALLALAARGWSTSPSIVALIAGLVLISLADVAFAVDTANSTYAYGDALDVLWPAGAALLGAAPWLRTSVARPLRGEPVKLGIAISAGGVAAGLLLLDHYERQAGPTAVLASLTLISAMVYLAVLYRERVEAQAVAVSAEASRASAAQASLDAVVSVGADFVITEWNHTAEEIFGYEASEAIGSDVRTRIVRPQDYDRYTEAVMKLARSDSVSEALHVEAIARRRDGSEFPVELSASRTRDDPPVLTAFIHDITRRREREEQNLRLAAIVRSSDDAMLSKTLDGKVTAWSPGAENLFGYHEAEVIGRNVEELIVPADRQREWIEIVERVRREGPITTRTVRRNKGGDYLNVVLRAFPIHDLGGNLTGISVVVREVMAAARRERAEARRWRAELSAALGEGRVHFHAQPMVDPRTGGIRRHELLMRLEKDGEILPPGKFLPQVEQSDMMGALDRWAIRSAFELGTSHPVAVNLSGRSLSDPGLFDFISRARLESDCEPWAVTFEITETAAVENLDAARDLVSALRGLGCGFSLDDFGTGYGTFTYLKHLPVTELKIDMEFIRGIEEAGPTEQRLVRSIVDVARNFEMKTVAEGVEKEQALAFIRELGVDLAQGYLIGRPAPIDPHDWQAAGTYEQQDA